eukprot:GFYU01001497.1.p1 GENE.GFYU01001497.1~~GFYU01001497.1.p1  ORF type:complete len:321 (+),score=73.78 GFYU01001497.1:132-965(+)
MLDTSSTTRAPTFCVVRGNNPRVVTEVMSRRTWWKQVPEDSDWTEVNMLWKPSGKGVEYGSFNASSQKPQLVNHFENNHEICTKTGMVRNLKTYYQTLKKDAFTITPTTYILKHLVKDKEYHSFIAHHKKIGKDALAATRDVLKQRVSPQKERLLRSKSSSAVVMSSPTKQKKSAPIGTPAPASVPVPPPVQSLTVTSKEDAAKARSGSESSTISDPLQTCALDETSSDSLTADEAPTPAEQPAAETPTVATTTTTTTTQLQHCIQLPDSPLSVPLT